MDGEPCYNADEDEVTSVNKQLANKTQKCINPNCSKTNNIMSVASILVSSYFGQTKEAVVCELCLKESMHYYEKGEFEEPKYNDNAESGTSKDKQEPGLLEDNAVKLPLQDMETDFKEELSEDEFDVTEITKVCGANRSGLGNPSVWRLITVNTRVYISVDSYDQSWIRGTVIQTPADANNGPFEDNEGSLYTIKTDRMDRMLVKEVKRRNMAYITQSAANIDLGTRVIAILPDSDEYSFYSATVMEEPCIENSFRHMLFYDNGYVGYIDHDDIRVIYDFTPNCWKDVPLSSKKVVGEYFRSYGSRRLIEMKPSDRIRLICNGSPRMAIVVEVDASIAKVRFIGGSTEWIYRGSPRIKRLLASGGTNAENENTISKASNATSYSKTNVEHECGPKCISNDLRVNVECIRGLSQLELPLYYKFRRIIQIVNNGKEETVKQVVVYIAPCGRKLRRMKETLDYLRITKAPFTVDCFNFDHWVRCGVQYKTNEKFVINQDISNGLEKNPIKCVNDVDTSVLNFNGYMTARKPSIGVKLNTDKEFLCGCDCEDDCRDKSKCACCLMTIDAQKTLPNNKIDVRAGYKYRRLYDNLITGVFECNAQCKCSRTTCLNRVVQLPTLQKLQLFKTEKKGWGVRCLNDIPAGSFVCIYTGHLLTDKSANERGRKLGDEYFAELDYMEMLEERKEGYESDVPEEKQRVARSMRNSAVPRSIISCSTGRREPRNNAYSVSYNHSNGLSNFTSKKSSCMHKTSKEMLSRGVFSVKNQSSKDKEKGNAKRCAILKMNEPRYISTRSYYGPDESVYIMDARTNGNIGRYLNHSCYPNLFVQNVFVDTQDLRFPWIAFFAQRYIKAGSELSWDYNYEIDCVKGKLMFCHCGSKNCRNRLF